MKLNQSGIPDLIIEHKAHIHPFSNVNPLTTDIQTRDPFSNINPLTTDTMLKTMYVEIKKHSRRISYKF